MTVWQAMQFAPPVLNTTSAWSRCTQCLKPPGEGASLAATQTTLLVKANAVIGLESCCFHPVQIKLDLEGKARDHLQNIGASQGRRGRRGRGLTGELGWCVCGDS